MATESSLHIDPNAFQDFVDDEKYLEDEEIQTRCKIQKALDEELGDFEISEDEFDDEEESGNSVSHFQSSQSSQFYDKREHHFSESPPISDFPNHFDSSAGVFTRQQNCQERPIFSIPSNDSRSVSDSVKPEVLDEAAATLRPLHTFVNGFQSPNNLNCHQSNNGFVEVDNSMTWDLSCPGDMLQPAANNFSPDQSTPLPLVLDSNNANSCQLGSWTFGYHQQIHQGVIATHTQRVIHADASINNFPFPDRHFPPNPNEFPHRQQHYSSAQNRNDSNLLPSSCHNQPHIQPALRWPHHNPHDNEQSGANSLQISNPMLSKSIEVTTRDVEVDAVPLNQHEIDQLEGLYEARLRKIEDLKEELSTTREQLTKELRITRHKLTLMETEKAGLAETVKETQRQLTESKSTIEKLNEELFHRDKRIMELNRDYDEIVRKLTVTAESAEALNQQLVEMTTMETLQKAKDQQITFVNSMKDKYSQDLLDLQENLDQARSDVKNKEQKIYELERDLKEALSNQQLNRWEQSDLINKLTKSLDESQKRCQELLESASSEELSHLRQEVLDAHTSKDITEEVNSALQEELSSVKEQLAMYENAVHLGLGQNDPNFGPDYNPMNDTLIQCGLAPPKRTGGGHEDTTNLSCISLPAVGGLKSSHQEILSLRKELEQCLNSYRSKRLENSNLREECFEVKRQLQQTKRLLDQSERTTRDKHERILSLEAKLQDLECSHPTAKEINLMKQVEALQMEKEFLFKDLESTRNQLSEITECEAKLTMQNQELSEKLNQIFQDLDQERKVSLDRLQETCSAHYEAALGKARESIMKQADEKVATIKKELKQCLKELNDVKELYVNVCEEKDQLEKGLREEFDQEMGKLKENMMNEAEVEKEKAVTEAKADMEMTQSKEMLDFRLTLMKEREEETKRETEVQLALAKADWLRDREISETQAVESAVKEKEREFGARMEELTAEIENSRSNQRSLDELVSVGCQTCQEDDCVNQELIAENEQLQTEVRSLKALEESLESKELDLLRENEKQRLQINNLEQSLSNCDLNEKRVIQQIRTKHEENIRSLQGKIADLKTSLTEAQTRERRLVDQLAVIQEEKVHLLEEQSKSQIELQSSNNEISKLNEMLADIGGKQIDTDSTMNTPEISLFTTSRQEENERVRSLQEDFDLMDKRHQYVLIERDNLRMEIQEMEKELKRMESTFNSKLNDYCTKKETQFRKEWAIYSKEKRAEWQTAAWRYLERKCIECAENLAHILGRQSWFDYRGERDDDVTRVKSSGDTRTCVTPDSGRERRQRENRYSGISASASSAMSPFPSYSDCKTDEECQEADMGKRSLKQFSNWLLNLLNAATDKLHDFVNQMNDIHKLLATKDEKHRVEVEMIQSNHKQLMEALRHKTEELKENYSTAMSNMQKQMEEERRRLFGQVNNLSIRLKNQEENSQNTARNLVSRHSSCNSSAIQTDLTGPELDQCMEQHRSTHGLRESHSGMIDEEVRAKYENTVKKIRDEVLSYLSASQSRTSAALRREILLAERRSCCQFASTMRHILTHWDTQNGVLSPEPTSTSIYSVASMQEAARTVSEPSRCDLSSGQIDSPFAQQQSSIRSNTDVSDCKRRAGVLLDRDWLLGVLDTIILNSSSPDEDPPEYKTNSTVEDDRPKSVPADNKHGSGPKAEWLPCNNSIVFEPKSERTDGFTRITASYSTQQPFKSKSNSLSKDEALAPLSQNMCSFVSESTEASFCLRDDPSEILKRIKNLYDSTFENCLSSENLTPSQKGTPNFPNARLSNRGVDYTARSSLSSRSSQFEQIKSSTKKDSEYAATVASGTTRPPVAPSKYRRSVARKMESPMNCKQSNPNKVSRSLTNTCEDSICLIESSSDYGLRNDIKSKPEDPVLKNM